MELPLATSLDVSPIRTTNIIHTNEIYTIIFDKKYFSISYSYQTGKLTIKSRRLNKYVFIMYDYDYNDIYL